MLSGLRQKNTMPGRWVVLRDAVFSAAILALLHAPTWAWVGIAYLTVDIYLATDQLYHAMNEREQDA